MYKDMVYLRSTYDIHMISLPFCLSVSASSLTLHDFLVLISLCQYPFGVTGAGQNGKSNDGGTHETEKGRHAHRPFSRLPIFFVSSCLVCPQVCLDCHDCTHTHSHTHTNTRTHTHAHTYTHTTFACLCRMKRERQQDRKIERFCLSS